MTTPISIPAAVERIEDRADDVRILTLNPLQPFTYRAGQYAHILAQGHAPRPYSIATPPGASGLVNFHIRNMGAGLSQHLSTNIQLGDLIAIEGPYGDMNPEHARERPVLMVAGGTGIAPMLAIASDIIRRGITEDGITLVYGARSNMDVYCRAELDQLLATGEVTAHIITDTQTPDLELRRLGLNLAHHVVYMSGPDPMMLSVHKALADHLADPSRVFTDADMNELQKAIP